MFTCFGWRINTSCNSIFFQSLMVYAALMGLSAFCSAEGTAATDPGRFRRHRPAHRRSDGITEDCFSESFDARGCEQGIASLEEQYPDLTAAPPKILEQLGSAYHNMAYTSPGGDPRKEVWE